MAQHPMPYRIPPLPSPRPFPSLARLARTAATVLLAVWVGPVSFDQTLPLLRGLGAPGRATASTISEANVVPAGEALVLEPGTLIELHLRDGNVLRGRFLGRALQDSAEYARRFAAAAAASGPAAFALGETLRVEMKDGREWTAPFTGWAEHALLLRGPAEAPVLHVPFEFARSIQRADGSPVAPAELARAWRANALPSADVLVLGARDVVGSPEERWASALRVPGDEIASVRLPESRHKGIPGIVIFAVGLTAMVLIIRATQHHEPAANDCDANWNWPAGGFMGARLTERPFDRSRGCWVDAPLARAEAGTGTAAPAFAAAPPAR